MLPTPLKENSLYMFNVMRGHVGLVIRYKTIFLRVKLKIFFFGQFYVQDAQKNHLIETTDVWHRSEMI